MDNQNLRDAGLKITLPRLRVLDVMQRQAGRHMSAEDVYRSLMDSGEDVGLATIYRVLTQFEQAGLVMRHNFEEGRAVFELDSGEHHDHIVCVKCGRITEFVDSIIERRQKRIASNHGFTLIDHSLVLYGECEGECRKSARERHA